MGHGAGGLCSSTTTVHGTAAAPVAATLMCANSPYLGVGNRDRATEQSHGWEG